VRRFLRMAVQLDGAPPAAALPLGFTLHAVTPSELRAVHSTLDEAFRDHWEHESEPFDQWWRRRSAAPDVELETGVWERPLAGTVTPGAARPPEPRPGP
jgi:hypothetical protein